MADCYGYNGTVSVDPTVILKMMFILFFDDIGSERDLWKQQIQDFLIAAIRDIRILLRHGPRWAKGQADVLTPPFVLRFGVYFANYGRI